MPDGFDVASPTFGNLSPSPTPGKWYIVKPVETLIPDVRNPGYPTNPSLTTGGEWISSIARQAYGIANEKRWVDIRDDVNNRPLAFTAVIPGLAQEFSWFFYPGDVIYIPELDSKRKKKLDKLKNEFTFVVEGKEVKITRGELTRTMDTISDGWEVEFPWEPNREPELDKLTRPFGFNPCEVYLGGDLQATGKIYNVRIRSSDSGRVKVLRCYSKTIDIVDSNLEPPFTFRNINLKTLITKIAAKHGVGVEIGENVDLSHAFKAIKAYTIEDSEFDLLSEMAERRGVLLSNDVLGNLLVHVADINGDAVRFEENWPLGIEVEFEFDGRKQYSKYLAIDRDPGRRLVKVRRKQQKDNYLVRDVNVSGNRVLNFSAYEIEAGDLKTAAEWRRNRALAESLSIPYPMTSWYDPNENLWEPNKNLQLISPTLGTTLAGYKFMIRAVKYMYNSKGVSSTLMIVPPATYDHTQEIVMPWGSL